MSGLWTILLFIIVIVVLIFSLVRASTASIDLLTNKSNDGDIDLAEKYMNWTVIILWIIIVGIILGVIALFIFGPELLPELGNTIFYLIFGVLVIAIITVGVISSISAYHIGISSQKVKFEVAYTNTIQAAVASLGSLGIFIVGYLLVLHFSGTPKKDYVDPKNGNPKVPASTPKTLPVAKH